MHKCHECQKLLDFLPILYLCVLYSHIMYCSSIIVNKSSVHLNCFLLFRYLKLSFYKETLEKEN